MTETGVLCNLKQEAEKLDFSCSRAKEEKTDIALVNA